MVSASSTILCDLRPLMSAMKPTPQESFSCAGSKSPKPCAPIVIFALPSSRPLPRRGVSTHIRTSIFDNYTILSRAVSALPRPSAVKDGVGHAPEGEPLFWRQPSCRLAAFNYRYAIVVARLPRSGAPSPSAAGPRASLPAPMSSPRFGERTGTGRARSGHPIRTAILSYAKHGRSRANAQGRTFLRLFAAAEKPGRRIKAYGFGLCGSVFRNVLRGQVDHGLCASAMPEWFAAAD